MADEFIGSRVRLEYDDQNESFSAYLPVEGVVSRRCAATTGPDDWYLVDLTEPIDYQHQISPHFQFKRLIIPRVLIRSRWSGMPLRRDTEPSVFLLLVANDQDVSTDPLDIAEFTHVCWARCHSLHAA